MQGSNAPESGDDLEKEYLDACSELAATKVAEELLIHPNSILPQKALLERYQEEMKKEFAAYSRRQKSGALQLLKALDDLSIEQPDLFTEEVIDGIESFGTLSARIAEDDKAFCDHILQGGNVQKFAGVGEPTMDCLYQAAKRLYEQNLFEEASDAFLLLTGLNPDYHLFWLGLANAEFHRKRYKEACSAYDKALELDPFDPSVHMALCQCYEALGEKDNALNTLDLALKAIEERPEYDDWKQVLENKKLQLR